MRILLAMSGGVDSSTVAHMLKEEGHEVIGVRFTLWTDPLAPPLASILPSKCCNAQTALRVKKTCEVLAIPLHVLDLEKEFKKEVVDPFLIGYKKGLTPNPCIGCNKNIKFGKLLELKNKLHCEKLATGHYARVAKESLPNGLNRYILLEAIDQSKDQSYYLYGLTQEQLSHVTFPLGGIFKRDVFALAAKYGVPLPSHYQESQDLCFFPEKTPHQFLKRHLRHAMKPGNIVRRDGTVVGLHKGLPLYTIGQRRGLAIGGLKVPLEVVAKKKKSNELIVNEKGTEKACDVSLRDLQWISWKPEEEAESSFTCRTRSLAPKKSGKLFYKGSNGFFRFEFPQEVQAEGQSLVFYRGEEIVGGGVITSNK